MQMPAPSSTASGSLVVQPIGISQIAGGTPEVAPVDAVAPTPSVDAGASAAVSTQNESFITENRQILADGPSVIISAAAVAAAAFALTSSSASIPAVGLQVNTVPVCSYTPFYLPLTFAILWTPVVNFCVVDRFCPTQNYPGTKAKATEEAPTASRRCCNDNAGSNLLQPSSKKNRRRRKDEG